MQSLWKEMRSRSSHRHLNFATHVQPWHGTRWKRYVEVEEVYQGKRLHLKHQPANKTNNKKSTTQPNTLTQEKHVISFQMKRRRCPLILLQREMGEVNIWNVKMKEMNEREIPNGKKGLVRDKAVGRSKGKTEAMVWLEEEVFQSLSE